MRDSFDRLAVAADTLYCRARRKACFLRGDARGVAAWSNRIATRKASSALRRHFREDVPPAVNLEITTDCNYACPFCPQSSSRRPSSYVTAAGFEHVIEELLAIRFEGMFVLAVNNEPFLHPLLPTFCEQVAVRLPRVRCMLISNGSLITRDHLSFLAGLPRPPILTVNDYTGNHSVAARLSDWRSSMGPDAEAWFRIELRSRSEQLSNRAGNQPSSDAHLADYAGVICTWPFGGVFLTPDLRAYLCCSDYQHDVVLGDLGRQSLMKIWTGDGYRDIRRKMLETQRRHLPLCRQCDAEWFCLPEHCA